MTLVGFPLPVGEGEGEGTLREPLPARCTLTPALSRMREREHHSSPHRGFTDFGCQISLARGSHPSRTRPVEAGRGSSLQYTAVARFAVSRAVPGRAARQRPRPCSLVSLYVLQGTSALFPSRQK